MMEAIRVKMKNILQKSVGSLNKIIPMITVPTAPIPVHTAYAVPIGNDNVARYNKNMLMERQTKKPVIHQADVDPVVSLAFPKQVAKPISKKPAMIKRIQFIDYSF